MSAVSVTVSNTRGPRGLTGEPGSDAEVTQANISTAITDPQAFRANIGANLGVEVSNDVRTLLNAHASANAGCSTWALRQWAWALSELEAGGILDELKDGICLRSGFNIAGTIKTLRAASVTVSGTVPLTSDGALFTGESTNRLALAVTDSSVFTHVVDFHYSPDAPALSAICGLTAVGGTNSSGNLLINVDPVGSVFNAAGGSAANTTAFGDSEDANAVHRYNPTDVIAGYSSDNAASPTIKAYANGVPVFTDASGNYQTTAALTLLTIGAGHTATPTYTYPMVGTVASSLLFNRVLTDAEHVVAAKASRHLDPRRVNIVTYGDSRTTQLCDAAKITGNWPYQYAASPQLARTARLCNIAHNGWMGATMASSFTARGGHLAPNGTSIESAHLIVWTGANDWLNAITAAAAWASVQSILRAARALGMRVTACTDPEGGAAYDVEEEAQRVAFNALVLAAVREWDSVWDLDSVIGDAHDVALWLDDVHLNNEGNRALASNLSVGGFARTPSFT